MSIKVQIVDDSAVIRQAVQDVLQRDLDIEITGSACDPLQALEQMQEQWPDVIVLDIEMPKMDGITFLKKLMREHPTPVVICSSLGTDAAAVAVEALAAGAFTIIAKPMLRADDFLRDTSTNLLTAVRGASTAKVLSLVRPHLARVAISSAGPRTTADSVLAPPVTGEAGEESSEQIIAIGISIGGAQALEQILPTLPVDSPGLLIVQHMPKEFTTAYASRMDSLCAIEVREAQSGDVVTTGRALIAPGGKHMVLRRDDRAYRVDVMDGPLVSRHRPSIDVLFRSVAKCAGRNALGIIMTGIGDDGANGLREMREAGARTYVQDDASCVVVAMPHAAKLADPQCATVTLRQITELIISMRKVGA